MTAQNESVICVLVGKAKRQGAGLWVEAGHKTSHEVLDIVSESTKTVTPKMRVKSIQAISAPVAMKQSGVSGSVTENILFFWRGSWPSQAKPMPRPNHGGTTWDDAWTKPMTAIGAVLQVPYVIKSIVMEAPWLAMARAAGASAGEELGEEDAAMEEQDAGNHVVEQKAQAKSKKDKKQNAKKGTKQDKKKGKDKEQGKEKKDNKGDKDEGKGKKDKKDGKDSTPKSKSKGKNKPKAESKKKKKTKSNPKSRQADKKEDTLKKFAKCPLPAPAYLEVDPLVHTEEMIKDAEPLFLTDYHKTTWQQVFDEFQSRGGCIWTAANGVVALAGVKNEFPVVVFCMNETHAQIVTHYVEASATILMKQIAWLLSCFEVHPVCLIGGTSRRFAPSGLRGGASPLPGATARRWSRIVGGLRTAALQWRCRRLAAAAPAARDGSRPIATRRVGSQRS